MRRINLEKLSVSELQLNDNDSADRVGLRLEALGPFPAESFTVKTYELDGDDIAVLREAVISDGNLKARIVIEVDE